MKVSGPEQRRIVHVGKFYPPHMGGIETHLQNLCRELAGPFQVHAVVSNDGPECVDDLDGAVAIKRIGTRLTISSAPVCPGFGEAIRDLRPDLLHLHLPNPTATLAVLFSGYRGPVVTTYHSDVVRQRILGTAFEPFLRAILRRSSAIVCTSQRYLDTSPTAVRYREKSRVIPYGIPAASQEIDLREVLSIRQRYGPYLIIAVGRLVYYKGFEVLIEAMKAVDGRLLIVGDGPLRSALQQQIASNGLEDKVVLLGEIQNERLTPWYRAADVFAFPSIARSEAFGIVQLEAMANGLPVVNTDLDSGVPFVSRHNETGITVQPGDPKGLANALNTLMADRALRACFSAAARHRVRTEFTLEAMARKTIDLYEDVLAGDQTTARPAGTAIAAAHRSKPLSRRAAAG